MRLQKRTLRAYTQDIQNTHKCQLQAVSLVALSRLCALAVAVNHPKRGLLLDRPFAFRFRGARGRGARTPAGGRVNFVVKVKL